MANRLRKICWIGASMDGHRIEPGRPTSPNVRLDVVDPRRNEGEQRMSMCGMHGVMNMPFFCYEKK